MSNESASPIPQSSSRYGMLIIGILFFIFGFVTWLNSVLIPFLRQACELTDTQAYFVTFAFYIAYFVMSIPSSYILRWSGYDKGMSIGLVTMAVGSLLFIPAAYTRQYPIFLLGLFIQGTGLSLLQTASNPYVTILGPIESAARRMSIMGICNKVAGMIGIFILGKVLFGQTEALAKMATSTLGDAHTLLLDELALKLVVPYIAMACVLVLLAIWVRFAHLPKIQEEADTDASTADASHADRGSIMKYPYLWLGVVCLFLYVGVEVIAIDTLALYGESIGMPQSEAVHLGIYSLIALTAGYIVGIVTVPRFISQSQALCQCACLGLCLAIGALCTDGRVSMGCLIMLSFSHALMWPCIWPLSIHHLGKYTAFASALLIMAIAGGAIMPQIYGHLADAFSRHSAYIVLIPCYLYIIFFAVKGRKIGA